ISYIASTDVVTNPDGTTSIYGIGTTRTIKAGVGDAIIVGGIGNNAITGGTGDDIILGQDGKITYNTTTVTGGDMANPLAQLADITSLNTAYSGALVNGFVDQITGSVAGNDIIIGGTGGSNIQGSIKGDDVIVGDNGDIQY